VETQADGVQNLQLDSVSGAVPPNLAGMLDTQEFNGPDGQQLQLVMAPAGTFASYPNQDVYALVDSAASFLGQLRLRVLSQALPHASGDKVWLSDAQLMFPLDPGVGDISAGGGNTATPPVTLPSTAPPAPSPPSVPGGTTVTGTVTNNGGSWTATITICVGSSNGGPLTGYDNISVVYQVATMYSTYQDNYQISSTTGCVTHSYPGQPSDGNVQIQVLNVLNYSVSGTSSTPLWNGVKPSLTLTEQQ
jgi:hypothetical protein